MIDSSGCGIGLEGLHTWRRISCSTARSICAVNLVLIIHSFTLSNLCCAHIFPLCPGLQHDSFLTSNALSLYLVPALVEVDESGEILVV